MKIKEDQIQVSWQQQVTYQDTSSEPMIHTMHLRENDMCQDNMLRVICEIKKPELGILDLRLVIKNISTKDAFIKESVLVDIHDASDLLMDGVDFRNWLFYRQGRHKNDLPGVCCLGKLDESFEDASSSLLENGDGATSDTTSHQLVSDSMSVIKAGESSILFGFLTGRSQMVQTTLGIKEDSTTKEVIFTGLSCKTIWNCLLSPGVEKCSEWLRLDFRRMEVIEKLNEFAKAKGKQYLVKKRTVAPSVFCTWYYYGLTVTYEDVRENLQEMQKKQLPFDVFQIDEGWELTLGEWQPNEKFPKSMAEIAAKISAAGYQPGIWTSPFIASSFCRVWKEHEDWILRDCSGKPIEFPMNDTTYYVFDITNPATYDYFRQLYHRLRYDWGYTYHKLDFTRAAVIYEDAQYHDNTVTLVEAYYQAVLAIREGMGEDAYFLMCGGLYDPIIGLVDAQRVGSDVLSMWSSNINKGGRTAPYTIKQNVLRYYMNYWWDNDPDALMVRRNEVMERDQRLTLGLLTEEEVKTSVWNQFIGGGLVCSTEPLAKMDDDRLYQLRHIMPTVPVQVIPRDLFNGSRYPSIVDVYLPEKEWHIVGIINWSDENEINASLTLNEETVGCYATWQEEYVVSEFYSGQYQTKVQNGQTITFGQITPHGTAIFKVQKMKKDQPMIVAGNGHYSLGGEVAELKLVENELIFSMEQKFLIPITYTILLPESYYFEDGSKSIDLIIDQREMMTYKIPVRKMF